MEEDGQGEEFDFKKGSASSLNFSRLENTKRILFDHPVPVVFHTHPSFTTEYLQSKGIKGADHPEMGEISVKDLAALYDLMTRNFSDSDLGLIEANTRYYRSNLLCSEYGYRWIINLNYKLPFIASGTFSGWYGKKYEERVGKVLKQLMEKGEINKELFNADTDSYLRTFCENTGMVVFGNDDYRSQKLYRV